MDGMLSQDEINALLSGMDAPSDAGSVAEAAPEEPIVSETPATPAAALSDEDMPDNSILSDI